MKNLFTVQYGSKLYGTSTATSDTDLKVVYLPSIEDLLMLRKPKIFKIRQDADGNRITDERASMPDGGVETEYFPLQTFVADFVQGQTYALKPANLHSLDRMLQSSLKSSKELLTWKW